MLNGLKNIINYFLNLWKNSMERKADKLKEESKKLKL